MGDRSEVLTEMNSLNCRWSLLYQPWTARAPSPTRRPTQSQGAPLCPWAAWCVVLWSTKPSRKTMFRVTRNELPAIRRPQQSPVRLSYMGFWDLQISDSALNPTNPTLKFTTYHNRPLMTPIMESSLSQENSNHIFIHVYTAGADSLRSNLHPTTTPDRGGRLGLFLNWATISIASSTGSKTSNKYRFVSRHKQEQTLTAVI